MPGPFCSTGPADLIRIDGSLRFDHRVHIDFETLAAGRTDRHRLDIACGVEP